MINTPIFYMGNKKRLIKKGLIDLFPNNIETFYDLFCGSGIVTLNVSANKYVINDIDLNIINLIKFFKISDKEEIINKINNIISTYQLPTFSTDNRKYKGDREGFKQKYNKLRDDYNKTRNVELLYVLNIFANSHMIRFNSKGEFNMPFGNSYFSEQIKKDILNNNYSKINILSNNSYEFINLKEIKENDFIYLDPPYLDTIATYNENGGWDIDKENKLLEFINKINKLGIKFAMSNVFENKGIVHKNLIEWCNNFNYNVYHFDDFAYYSNGKGTAKTDEVLITNYKGGIN